MIEASGVSSRVTNDSASDNMESNLAAGYYLALLTAMPPPGQDIAWSGVTEADYSGYERKQVALITPGRNADNDDIVVMTFPTLVAADPLAVANTIVGLTFVNEAEDEPTSILCWCQLEEPLEVNNPLQGVTVVLTYKVTDNTWSAEIQS